jgi:tRNA-binding protein
VCWLINVPIRNIAGFTSEFLLLGFSDSDGKIVIVRPDKDVPNGNQLH